MPQGRLGLGVVCLEAGQVAQPGQRGGKQHLALRARLGGAFQDRHGPLGKRLGLGVVGQLLLDSGQGVEDGDELGEVLAAGWVPKDS
jgi:hypothetical protein